MTTKAWLEGEQFDLLDLAALLTEGDVRIVRDDADDAFYLTAPELDNPPDWKTFCDVGPHLLTRLNGLGRVSMSDFRPVRLAGRYGTPEGTHVMAMASSEGRAHATGTAVVTDADGNLLPPRPSPRPVRLALAEKNIDVAEPLEIMGRPEPLNWYDMNKVFEIVSAAVGGERKLVRKALSTKADITAFTGSGNHPGVSGPDARHARMPGEKPSREMTQSQGRAYISNLVERWFQTL